LSARLEAALAELAAAIVESVAMHSAPGSTVERLLAIDEAAAILGIARSTLYGLIGRGEVATLKIGRRRLIPTGSIEHLIRDGDRSAGFVPAARARAQEGSGVGRYVPTLRSLEERQS
jgi:excisionase family DNA binding protein